MKKYLIILLSTSLFFVSCRESIHKVSRPQIGTFINLTIITDPAAASQTAAAVFKEIGRIEALMSPYKKKSDVYKINRFAASKAVAITPETFSLLEQARNISLETGGSFDISFAGISHLWNYKKTPFSPPSKKDIERLLPLVNYANIELNRETYSVAFKTKKMKIGLGGVAKGYAIKRGIEAMRKKGITSGIVDAGGDLQVLGSKAGQPWSTGLIHPRNKTLLLIIKLEHMDTIATSGDYERFAMFNNQRYHHIIDPKTGCPTRTFASVSVISKDPVISDSYATGIFVMGPEKAKPFLRAHKKISVILIDLDLNVYISKELKERITLLEEIQVTWI
ncbi:MAG: FAD:protein FMN transferase [bacterium]|nr:FAD:protein FMN transferase [bacterium]